MQAELIFDAKAHLGEGPIWDAKTQTFYWVDIFEKRIYAGNQLLIQLDEMIGCMAPCKNGHLLLALTSDQGRFSFVDLDPASKKLTVLSWLDSEPTTNRFNDGKCDPTGRFLAGTMNLNETDPTGSFYSYNGKQTTRLLDNITISNGLTWSVDHKTFYYIDTPTRQVQAFDYDLSTGKIANPRRVIYFPEALGWPDGMTSDTEGNLWVAMWGGAQITKWNPNTGKLLEQIPVPALNTSCPVFGGKNMNELYVTSARKGMTEAELERYPLSGGLFKVDTKVEGMPNFEFANNVS